MAAKEKSHPDADKLASPLIKGGFRGVAVPAGRHSSLIDTRNAAVNVKSPPGKVVKA